MASPGEGPTQAEHERQTTKTTARRVERTITYRESLRGPIFASHLRFCPRTCLASDKKVKAPSQQLHNEDIVQRKLVVLIYEILWSLSVGA